MNEDEYFMKKALAEAKKAADIGEAPIGAVIVRDGKIIARAHNRRETKKNALCHAEISVIDKACRKLGGWRLPGCAMYVTLEPCPMCAGAIINSRIEKVVFGASDPKAGACGSVVDLFAYPFNHHPRITGGVLGGDCGKVLSEFFLSLREKKKAD